MADDQRSALHFQVQWGDIRIGFAEVSGLDAKPEMVGYRDQGPATGSRRRVPGMQKYPNVTLKRGLFRSGGDYVRWRNAVSLDAAARRDVIVTLLNEAREPVRVWTIKNAWPAKIESADFNADGNEVAIESIELSHEGIVL